MRARAILLTSVAVLAWATGCGGSPTPHSALRDAGSPSASTPAGPSLGPAMIRARRMPPTEVRLPVSSADLSDLARVRGDTIVALADDGAFFGEVYPAISYDDGGDWRIDGPQFARAAACGGCTTNRLAVSLDGTIMAWGRLGNSVKTTTDLGRRWRIAYFGGVKHASVSGRRLVVVTLATTYRGERVPPLGYVSRDDGRTWHRLTSGP